MCTRLRMPSYDWGEPRHLRCSRLFCCVPAEDKRTKLCLEAVRHGMWPIKRHWVFSMTIHDQENHDTWVEFQYFHIRMRRNNTVRMVAVMDSCQVGIATITFNDEHSRANVALHSFGAYSRYSMDYAVITLDAAGVGHFDKALQEVLRHAATSRRYCKRQHL